MKRVSVFPIIFFILFSFSIPMAFGQIQTRFRVLQASNVGDSIDPSLRDVYGELGSLFSFTSYRLLRDETLDLTLNRPVEISSHPGRFMEVSLIELRGKLAKLRIQVVREKKVILLTEVRLPPGRTVLIGGPRHGEGVIIYAISARF